MDAADAPVEVVVTLRLPRSAPPDRSAVHAVADRLVREVTRDAHAAPERAVVMANLGVVVVRASPVFVRALLDHEVVHEVRLEDPHG